MNLRCKVFRAEEASKLETAVNHFLDEELEGAVQFEEITQSEGPSGVTLVLWYSTIDELERVIDDSDELEAFDEIDGKELA